MPLWLGEMPKPATPTAVPETARAIPEASRAQVCGINGGFLAIYIRTLSRCPVLTGCPRPSMVRQNNNNG